MEKLSHDEYVNMKKKEIVEVAKGIIKDELDIIAACRFIFLNWHEAEFPEDSNYGFISHLDDELEVFSPDKRNIYNKNYSLSLKGEEKKFIDYYKKYINQLSKYIIDINSNV